jgi:hypothetical protein
MNIKQELIVNEFVERCDCGYSIAMERQQQKLDELLGLA